MSFVEKRSVADGGVPRIELQAQAKKIDSSLDQNEPQVEENQNQVITKYLFTCNSCGELKQWGIEQQKLMKDFGKIHLGYIWSITITNDGRYLFTSNNHGYLKQWDIEQQKLMKDFGKIHSSQIYSITATNDG